MSKSSWDKGFTSGAKAARKVSANSVCTLCCDGCKEHGERVERDRREKWLNRVRTWNQDKSDTWHEGYEIAETRIIKLLEEHLGYGDSEWDANVKAIIALIKGANK